MLSVRVRPWLYAGIARVAFASAFGSNFKPEASPMSGFKDSGAELRSVIFSLFFSLNVERNHLRLQLCCYRQDIVLMVPAPQGSSIGLCRSLRFAIYHEDSGNRYENLFCFAHMYQMWLISRTPCGSSVPKVQNCEVRLVSAQRSRYISRPLFALSAGIGV
jgi:hypothetical protein